MILGAFPSVVAVYTGLRRGEQLALRWSNVDVDGARLRVVEALDETKASGVTLKAPKSAAGVRTITLPQVVVDALREHRRRQLEMCLLLGLGKPSPTPPWSSPAGGRAATSRRARSRYAGAGRRPGWACRGSSGTACGTRVPRC